MEDAATAEIARVQLWQWVKYGSKTVSRRGQCGLYSFPSLFSHSST
jgi:malate synthase